MKLAIVLLFIYSALLEADPQQDWYKTQLNTHILPPYSMAYNILQTRIINELVSVNVALLNDASTTQLANRLLCAARDARTSLDQSVAASDQLRNQINEKVTGSVTQVGTYEESIANKTLEIQQTDQSLIGALAALASAQQAVRDKEASVQAAQQAVNAAEDAVEKARKCHGLLGKRSDTDMPITSRGWFSSITRPIVRPIENAIKDVIIKPVCSAINTGPLNEAKNRRDGAYAELQRARDQVVHYTQLVANHQAQKTNLDAQLVQLHSNLKAVQAALEILRDELKVTISIDTQVNSVEEDFIYTNSFPSFLTLAVFV